MALSDFSLDGKVAIVQGVGPGIGYHTALALARAGADVTIAARNKERLEQFAEEIRAETGRRCLPVPTDVTDSQQVNEMVARTVKEFGTVHILVNNTGGTAGVAAEVRPTESPEMPDDEFDRVIRINLHSVFYCARAVAPYMKAQKWGRIINTSSVAGYRGRRDTIAYSAGKAGMQIMSQALGHAWAQDGITVNVIVVGLFPQGYWALPPEQRDSFSYRGNRPGDRLPVGRPGHPSEYATLAVFLASDAASYTTGEIIPIDGAATEASIAPSGYVFRGFAE